MHRSHQPELLDADGVSEETLSRCYRELQMVNRLLGNTWAIVRLLQQTPVVPASILDIGCGHGALLAEIGEKTGATVVGFDMRVPPAEPVVPIFTGNAVTDSLPRADVAVCVLMAHHLAPPDVVRLIRNVSRSCDRLILLDLVRHRVPLVLFSLFVAPFLGRINAADGKTSVRRAYTTKELQEIVQQALGDRPVRSVRHSTAPFWIRQIVDVTWD